MSLLIHHFFNDTSGIYVARRWWLLSLFLLISYRSQGSHILGNDISYRYIDSLKYEVTFRFYRDCKDYDFDLFAVQTRIKCSSTSKTKALSLKLRSITDITPICPADTQPCSPQNTYATGKGIEMHVYAVTIDFADSAYYPFYQCGEVIVETLVPTRSSAITTGGANTTLVNYAMLDLVNGSSNSSPVIRSLPERAFTACNQAFRHHIDLLERDAGDSVSFHLVPALTPNGPVKYSGVTYDAPFHYYDPFNTGQAYPNANPPIGFFLDPVLGHIIFTPTKCDEVTILAYEVWEWRKDSSGAYQRIGITRRDMTYTVEAQFNNPPFIYGPYSYSVCDGEELKFQIKTGDKVFRPPPPLPTPDPDTVSLYWTPLFSDASLEVVDSTAQLPVLQFSWKAKYQDSSDNLHHFILTAKDNHCPFRGISSATFQIRVLPQPAVKPDVSTDSCGWFSVQALNKGNLSYVQWMLFDTSGQAVTDTGIVQFGSNNSYASFRFNDKFLLRSNDTFRLRLREPQCGNEYWDTLFRTTPYYPLFSTSEPVLCDQDTLLLRPDLSDTGNFIDFLWNTGPADTFSSIRTDSAGIFTLTARDINGCTVQERISVAAGSSPELSGIPDDTLCIPFAVTMDAALIVDSGDLEMQYLWENGDTSSARIFDTPGVYHLQVHNECGRDSAVFRLYGDRAPALQALHNDTICETDSLVVQVLDSSDIGLPRVYKWNDGVTGRKRSVRKGGLYQVVVQNQCGSDTASFSLHSRPAPHVDFGPDTVVKLPFQFLLVADTVQGTYSWNTGDTTRSILVSDTGTYWVLVINDCGQDRDTIRFSKFVSVPGVSTTNIQIVPNPTNGTFRIAGLPSDPQRIALYSLKGEKVSELDSHKREFDVSGIPKGLYMLRISTGEQVYMSRIGIY